MAQIQVIENFNGFEGVPDGWYSMGYNDDDAQLICEGISLWSNLTGGNPNNELATPYLAGASNGTDLSINYDIKIVNWNFWDGQTPVNDGWGTIDVEYTKDSVNWILLETISDQNYDAITQCATRSYDVPADSLPNGTNFQMRLKGNFLFGGFYIIVDNFNIVQLATSAPNCDAPLTSPANGETDVELEASVNWSYSTGLPTGYKISIGSSPGATDIADNVDVGNVYTYTPTAALEYSTTYYVTILSYNAFGEATGCTEQSFTTRMPPPPGSSCSAPIVITEFPFDDSNTNEGYDNDYNVSPCNNGYMKGHEVVYEITPTEEISINITFDSIVGNRPSIHVLDGCPDVAENCLAYYGAYNPQPQYFEEIILAAGQTYYIVIATSLETNFYEYHLGVTKNSCVIPDATYTSVGDCENDQYYVDVEITRFGSAETYTISDDQGSDPQQADTLGVSTFGPYPTGTAVNFTVTNDQDESCVITGAKEFHCNDFCFAAYEVPVNPGLECVEMVSGSLGEATTGTEDLSLCEQTNAKDVWFTFEATNSIHTIELLNVQAIVGFGTSVYYEVLEGACGSLTSVMCSAYKYNNVADLTVGQTYYVRVFNASGTTSHRFDICISTPQDAPANNTCSGAMDLPVSTDETCDNMIAGTTISATKSEDNSCSGNYNEVWFAFSPEHTGYYHFDMAITSGTAQTRMSYWVGSCGDLTRVSDCSENGTMEKYAVAGETSYVMVRSLQGSPGVDFTLCAYRIFPPANNECHSPVMFEESVDASGNNLIIESNAGATNSFGTCYSNTYEGLWYSFTAKYTGEYTFDFTKISTGSSYYTIFEEDCDDLVYVEGFSSCYNSSNKNFQVVAGNTYKVSVHSPSPVIYQFFVYPVNPTPSNDLCDTPDVLMASTAGECENVVSGYTYSTNSTAGNDCGAGNYDVWYAFTPDSTGYYQFDLTQTAGTAATGMALFSGECGSFDQVSVNCDNASMIESLEAGVTYTVMVTSDSEGGVAAGVEFDLCAYQVTPPANNDCAEAIVFDESATNAGENTVSGTNEYATYSEDACYESSYAGVWYTFTPNYSGQYTLAFTGTTGAASYAVYSGVCGELAAVTMNCYNSESTSFDVEAGSTYMVSVQAEETSAFEFFVYPDFVVPVNNECDTPETLNESTDGTCDNLISGTTFGAGNSDVNTCSETDQEVWYTFTPENDGYYQFDLTQTSESGTAYMALFSGDCGDFTMESADCNNTSIIQQLTGGTTYTLMVASDTTEMGVNFDVCAYQYFPPANNDCVGAESFTESADSTGNNLVIGTNDGAFYSPEACYDETYQGVWYTFTAMYTGTYVLDFTGVTGAASYTVYTGDCETLELATGVVDCYNTENAMIETEAGTTYMVSVHSEGASTYEFFVYPAVIVGTEDLTETAGLKYFPNPVSGDKLNFTADYEMSNITVFNTLGQKVISEMPESMNHVMNMAHLEAGIYFVKVTIDGVEQTVKVIKD